MATDMSISISLALIMRYTTALCIIFVLLVPSQSPAPHNRRHSWDVLKFAYGRYTKELIPRFSHLGERNDAVHTHLELTEMAL